MRIINNKQLMQAASPMDFLSAVEKAFLLQEKGGFLMPDRMHAEYDGNVLLLMPAFSHRYFGTKLVSVFPENRKKGEDVITGALLLNDGTTGKPLALLDAASLTAFRTAAVGALGIAYTTPKEVSRLGLIGAGTQGFHQALFACVVRNIAEINVFDPFHPDLASFIRDLQNNLPSVKISIQKNAEKLVSDSEVIITATTALHPVIPENATMKGKHFIGIGSFRPEMREFPDTIWKHLEHLVIDTNHARTESGDVRIPLENNLITEDRIYRLGELMNGTKQLDVTKTTFFKIVGMALFDLMAAQMVYEKALEKDLGTEVEF
jgi:ornithine cyclodeaminase